MPRPIFFYLSLCLVHLVMAAGNLRRRECFALVHIHLSDYFALLVHDRVRAALGYGISAVESH